LSAGVEEGGSDIAFGEHFLEDGIVGELVSNILGEAAYVFSDDLSAGCVFKGVGDVGFGFAIEADGEGLCGEGVGLEGVDADVVHGEGLCEEACELGEEILVGGGGTLGEEFEGIFDLFGFGDVA